MKVRGLYVWCVSIVVCVGVEVLSSEEERFIRRAGTPEPRVFYIYPRSGRLFHADYVRDNEIFQSLERTNFMRRGPFTNGVVLRRTKIDGEEETVKKKHTYVDARRIPGGKKSVLGIVREVPFKVLNKLSDIVITDSRKLEKRIKRDLTNFEGLVKDNPITTKNEKENPVEEFHMEIPKESVANFSIFNTNDSNITKENENKVEGDENTNIKRNDTDKTLLALDSVLKTDQPTSTFHVPELGVLQEDLMKKLVLDDSLSLYPVYTGVKYTYPRTERSLQYTPEMVVQMDNPEVTDYVGISESNSTADYQEEGRGRRRRIKKLAFPLLLALKLKAAVMLPLILGLISLVAFKGLWSGLTALGVAAALGLKALVGSGAPRVVVQAPPHYHHPPPHEYAEYWSRRDDFSDYRPSNWS